MPQKHISDSVLVRIAAPKANRSPGIANDLVMQKSGTPGVGSGQSRREGTVRGVRELSGFSGTNRCLPIRAGFSGVEAGIEPRPILQNAQKNRVSASIRGTKNGTLRVGARLLNLTARRSGHDISGTPGMESGAGASFATRPSKARDSRKADSTRPTRSNLATPNVRRVSDMRPGAGVSEAVPGVRSGQRPGRRPKQSVDSVGVAPVAERQTTKAGQRPTPRQPQPKEKRCKRN